VLPPPRQASIAHGIATFFLLLFLFFFFFFFALHSPFPQAPLQALCFRSAPAARVET